VKINIEIKKSIFVQASLAALFLVSITAMAVFDGPVDWSASAGVSSSAVGSGAKSFWGNPAGILSIEKWGASVGWRQEWELDELSTGNVSGVFSGEWGSAAVAGSFTGKSSFYTENLIGMAYARRIWKIDTGLRANLGMAKTENWSASTFILGFGAVYPAGKAVSVGFWLDNFTASEIDGNTIPTRSAIGVKYCPTGWVNLHADYYFEGDEKPTMRFGQETIIADLVSIKGGVNFRPNIYHLGLGVIYSDFELSWCYISHPELGGSMMVGLEYER